MAFPRVVFNVPFFGADFQPDRRELDTVMVG